MLTGKTVLCIGGASGMGRGVAEAALEAAADVIVTSRTLEKAAWTAEALGCRAEAVDIEDEDSVAALFDRVGPFAHLMITAGAVGRAGFRDTPPDEARRFMDGKLWGTHRCLWHAKSAIDPSGSITLITGGYSQIVENDAGHVHAAFQAVEAMARVAAVSLAPVRCNVLRPGFIDSDLWSDLSETDRDALRAAEREKTLIGRLVEPIDFGRVAVQIIQAEVVTGAVIPVDGGRHLQMR